MSENKIQRKIEGSLDPAKENTHHRDIRFELARQLQ